MNIFCYEYRFIIKYAVEQTLYEVCGWEIDISCTKKEIKCNKSDYESMMLFSFIIEDNKN